MKKFLIAICLLVGLSVALWSCLKEKPEIVLPTESIQNTEQEASDRNNCSGTCTYRIKITSVSPANAGWILTVTSNNVVRFLSDNITTPCDIAGKTNNALNTWYYFTTPMCLDLRVLLGTLLNTSTCADLTGGSLTYILETVSATPANSVTGTLTLAANDDIYNTNVLCDLGECETDCTYRIRINSVSPSGGRWFLSVVSGGAVQFLSDNIAPPCDIDGTSNNALNTWYTFHASGCDEINVNLNSFSSPLSCDPPIVGVVNYTIQALNGSGNYTSSLSYTGTGVSKTYTTDPYCNLAN